MKENQKIFNGLFERFKLKYRTGYDLILDEDPYAAFFTNIILSHQFHNHHTREEGLAIAKKIVPLISQECFEKSGHDSLIGQVVGASSTPENNPCYHEMIELILPRTNKKSACNTKPYPLKDALIAGAKLHVIKKLVSLSDATFTQQKPRKFYLGEGALFEAHIAARVLPGEKGAHLLISPAYTEAELTQIKSWINTRYEEQLAWAEKPISKAFSWAINSVIGAGKKAPSKDAFTPAPSGSIKAAPAIVSPPDTGSAPSLPTSTLSAKA